MEFCIFEVVESIVKKFGMAAGSLLAAESLLAADRKIQPARLFLFANVIESTWVPRDCLSIVKSANAVVKKQLN